MTRAFLFLLVAAAGVIRVREEWSPGNCGFEIIDGKVANVHYDARGTALPHR